MKRQARPTRKQKRQAKAQATLPEKYQFAVDAAVKHFVGKPVRGEVVDKGTGFVIVVLDDDRRHLIRLKYVLKVDEQTVPVDFLDEPEKSRPARLAEAFAAVDKAIRDLDNAENRKAG